MKNKKNKILTVTLFLILILSSAKAFALSDINETDWFYNDVIRLTEKNIISGYPGNLFKPKGNIKNGETLKMIFSTANMNKLTIEYKDNESLYNKHWADDWKLLGISEGIIDDDFDLDKSTTRSEVAQFIVKVFNLEKKPSTKGAFEDTKDKYSGILYKLGIIKGSKVGNKVYFYPTAPISRAEICTILARVIDYEKNVLLHDTSIKEDSSYSKSPTTKAELRKVFINMLKNDLFELTVGYDDVEITRNDEFKVNITAINREIRADYPEYASYFDKTSYIINGTENTITFKKGNKEITNEEMIKMKEKFENKAKEVVIDLCLTGEIDKEMTETEKAKVLFEWIIGNTNYDYQISTAGFNGYGLLFNELATCQGYTATFNYMAKLLGIKVRGATGYTGNTFHIWTIAELDGKMVYIDVTWGDGRGNDKPDYMFFDISPEDLKRTHMLDDPRYELDSGWPY